MPFRNLHTYFPRRGKYASLKILEIALALRGEIFEEPAKLLRMIRAELNHPLKRWEIGRLAMAPTYRSRRRYGYYTATKEIGR